jgi:hypothetical protein
LLGDFYVIKTINQEIILRNDFNPNPLWLNENLILASRYKRNSEDLVGNLFTYELVKIYISQNIIICNGLMKWLESKWMTCTHGLGYNVIYYVSYDILIYNQVVNFDILNDHGPGLDH